MSKLEKNCSENEDDPEPYESSEDECDSSERKRNNRRSSTRLSKKPRITHVDDSSEDEGEGRQKKRRSKNGVNKKSKVKEEEMKEIKSNSNLGTKVNSRAVHRKFVPKTIYSDDFSTGTFVILKKDAQVGDPNKPPCIWRIDGKALLQKYEAFQKDGKVVHRNTSVYTGWTPLDKDLYAGVTVDVIEHNGQNLVLELHWDKLKDIHMDSD